MTNLNIKMVRFHTELGNLHAILLGRHEYKSKV